MDGAANAVTPSFGLGNKRARSPSQSFASAQSGSTASKRCRGALPFSNLGFVANSAPCRPVPAGPCLTSSPMMTAGGCAHNTFAQDCARAASACQRRPSAVLACQNENAMRASNLRSDLPSTSAPSIWAHRAQPCAAEASSTAQPVTLLTFSDLVGLPHAKQFRAAAPFGEPAFPFRPSTPTRPPPLAVSSEPSSLANLSPSLLRTPPTSRREGPPSIVRPEALHTEEAEYSTPDQALGTASLTRSLQTQLWAPCRVSRELSRALTHRRCSESSSDIGSPEMGTDLSSPPWRRCRHLSMHGGCSSDDGADSGGNRLVCNLVERFNNAQLYDGINNSP